MAYCILFVDDDINILNGLRRMLRGMRNEWQMVFVTSGEEAIQAMADTVFDVVVPDMRMPGMDGATLLAEVSRQQPKAIRIILSGHSEQEAILRAVGPTHQYLAKPCDAEKLIETINHAIGLRRYLPTERLIDLISGIQNLPSPRSSLTG